MLLALVSKWLQFCSNLLSFLRSVRSAGISSLRALALATVEVTSPSDAVTLSEETFPGFNFELFTFALSSALLIAFVGGFWAGRWTSRPKGRIPGEVAREHRRDQDATRQADQGRIRTPPSQARRLQRSLTDAPSPRLQNFSERINSTSFPVPLLSPKPASPRVAPEARGSSWPLFDKRRSPGERLPTLPTTPLR